MSPPAGDPLDLSGDWLGSYEYPRKFAPVAFTASVAERGGWLSGVVLETTLLGNRRAAMEGRRIGQAVTWLKTYQHRDVTHDVQYEGVVDGAGEEISGRWTIFRDWSGVFLMVRQSRAAAASQRRTAVRARD